MQPLGSKDVIDNHKEQQRQEDTAGLVVEKQGADKEKLEKFTLGALRKAVLEGDTEEGSLMAGQVCGQIKEIRPVKDIIEEINEGIG